jgi:hypothetical protein
MSDPPRSKRPWRLSALHRRGPAFAGLAAPGSSPTTEPLSTRKPGGIGLAISCLILLSAAGALVSQSASAAAPVRECGDVASRLAYNITTRSVTCTEARRVVRGWGRGNGPVRGMTCRYHDTGYEAGDIRCTGSRGRVVHWQTGS